MQKERHHFYQRLFLRFIPKERGTYKICLHGKFARDFWRTCSPGLIKDLKNFDKILADARTANTQGRYQDSESLFRKALDLQTKLLNENDISIAETLMDLALNVSNQGRDEEALALFRRAEPIIQVSPNDSDRARFASYQGYHEANSKRYDKALQFASEAVGSWRKIAAGPSIDFRVFLEKAQMPTQSSRKRRACSCFNLQANMALRLEQNELAQAAASEALQILNDTMDCHAGGKQIFY